MSKHAIALPNAAEMVVAGFRLTKTGIIVDGKPTKADWLEAKRVIEIFHTGAMWLYGDILNIGEATYDEVEEGGSYEHKTLKNAKYVCANVAASLRRDDLSFTHHSLVAHLPARQQVKWLKKAANDTLNVSQMRKAIKQEQKDRDRKENPLPPGMFSVVYADPPWDYNDQRTGTAESGAAAAQYSTLTVEELCKLADDSGKTPRDLRDTDAALFLWATAPMLPEAMQVMEAWGFAYKTHFIWDKVRGYNGHYSNVRHELLLLGIHGSFQPASETLRDSIVTIEKTRHSAKPADFYSLIEELYPAGPWVELFARNTRKEWSTWGNQV